MTLFSVAAYVFILFLFSLSTSIGSTTNPTLRLAFGSCSQTNREQLVWAALTPRHVDVFLWLGDIVYADTPIFAKWRKPAALNNIKNQYSLQEGRADYQNFLLNGGRNQTPPLVLGVWDDHDLGINDADVRVPDAYKKASQTLLLNFLKIPIDSKLRLRNGAYSAWDIEVMKDSGLRRLVGEGDVRTPNTNVRLRVRLILLDVRTHRAPWDAASHEVLGQEQWDWLRHALEEDNGGAEITLIGSGIQIFAPGDPPITEGWFRAPGALARLISLIAATHTRGAILLSGDVHFGELNVAEGAKKVIGYNLWEFTSSGLTHSWEGLLKGTTAVTLLLGTTRALLPQGLPFNSNDDVEKEPVSQCASNVPWREIAWKFIHAFSSTTSEASQDSGLCFYAGRNWGEIDIDIPEGEEGEPGEGVVRMRLWGEDGTVRLKHELQFNQLQRQPIGGGVSDDDIAACASADLSTGIPLVCQSILAAILPSISLGTKLRHVGAHVALIVGVVIAILAIVLLPLFAIVRGITIAPQLFPHLPSLIAKAGVVAMIAVLTTLILTPVLLFVADALMT